MDDLCGLFGKTRQAYYKSSCRALERQCQNAEILNFVRKERVYQSKIGVDKLLYMLRTQTDLDIGRDALYDLLRFHKLLVRRHKKYRMPTTNGDGSSIYPDLRKGLKVLRINELWSCDITYFWAIKQNKHCYATFVVDEYSHLITGHIVAQTMKAKDTLVALQIAVNRHSPSQDESLIFHTDRGGQFKSALFQVFLSDHKIRCSMTKDGKPSDNPVAERLNGILKDELLDTDTFEDFGQAKSMIDTAVRIYNTRRPHRSCEMLTPIQAHEKGSGPLKKLWKQRKKRKQKAQQT